MTSRTDGGETAVDCDALSGARLLLAPAKMMLPNGVVEDYAAVVENGAFSAVGPRAEIAAAHPDLVPVEMSDILMMPGFVDAHHHLTQSFGKALAFGEPSEIFRRVWVPLEGALDDDLVYLASKLASLEALRGGFTTVVDAGTRAKGDASSIAKATDEAGLRCVLGYICNDRGRESEGAAILARANAHLDRYEGSALVHASLAIAIPEAASDTMLGDVSRLCAKRGAIFQTHINEHLAAIERSLIERGLRPFEVLDKVGALGPQTLIAHATLMTPREMRRLAETDTAVAYNPVATQWKGNASCAAETMYEMGIRFGIGTDGTRSDGFRLVDAAEALQRTAFGMPVGDFSCGGGWIWMDHATRAGADAVGLKGITGAIAPGLRADYLLVDLAVPELQPSWDLTWELVRLGNKDQIVAVVVDGKLRLWQGWPVDWDGRALMREVATVTSAAVAAAPIHRVHPVSAEHRRLHPPRER